MQRVDHYDQLAVAQGIAALITVVLVTVVLDAADIDICLTTFQITQEAQITATNA